MIFLRCFNVYIKKKKIKKHIPIYRKKKNIHFCIKFFQQNNLLYIEYLDNKYIGSFVFFLFHIIIRYSHIGTYLHVLL